MSALDDPRIAAGTAVVTTVSGADLKWWQIMPVDVSFAAAALGCALTIVLIITHILRRLDERERHKQDSERHKLEMQILRRRLRDVA